MSWYGDPDGVDRLAARVGAVGGEVRRRAAAVRASSAQLHWRGPAADAFRAAVVCEAMHLDRAAGELDDAAAALHRHAEAVRQEIARLGSLQRAAEHALASGMSVLSRVVP